MKFNLEHNRPFHNLEKGTEESSAHSDSLGAARVGNLGNPLLAARMHLHAYSSYLQSIEVFKSFQSIEVYNTCLSW